MDTEARNSIEQMIRADLRLVFSRYSGKSNTDRTRKAMHADIQGILRKYRAAGLPVWHVRGLMDVNRSKFHVRIATSPSTPPPPSDPIVLCTECKGFGVVVGDDEDETKRCTRCDGTGREPGTVSLCRCSFDGDDYAE